MEACVHFNDSDETPPQTCSMLSVSPLKGFLSSVSRALELLWQRVYNGIELWRRHVWAHPGSDVLVYYQRHTLIMQHKCADTLEHTNTKVLTYTRTCLHRAVEQWMSVDVCNVCRRLTVPQATTGNYNLIGSCHILYEEWRRGGGDSK